MTLSSWSGARVSEDEIVARLRAAGSVFAEEETALLVAEARTPTDLASMVERRIAGEPLEVIVGWAEFCGLPILVEAGVFVPRRRTAFLAEQAIVLTAPGAVVVDLCCGTGALGVAVHAAVPDIDLHAADIEPVAIRCARRNLEPLGGRVHEGDLYAALPDSLRGRIDVLVVNAPYVPSGSIALMPPEARVHEPSVALDGGVDGLDVQRRVAADAAQWLASGGYLLMETSEQQAEQTLKAFALGGLSVGLRSSDELYATVVIGSVDSAERRVVGG